MNSRLSRIPSPILRNESISDDSSDDSNNDDEIRLPFSNILKGKTSRRVPIESISDDSSSDSESSVDSSDSRANDGGYWNEPDVEPEQEKLPFDSVVDTNPKNAITKDSIPVANHHKPVMLNAPASTSVASSRLAQLLVTSKPIIKPTLPKPTLPILQNHVSALENEPTAPVITKKRPRPINAVIPELTDSAFVISSYSKPAAETVNANTLNQNDSHRQGLNINRPPILLSKPLNPKPISHAPLQANRSTERPPSSHFFKDTVNTSHVRFGDNDDDVSSVISEEIISLYNPDNDIEMQEKYGHDSIPCTIKQDELCQEHKQKDRLISDPCSSLSKTLSNHQYSRPSKKIEVIVIDNSDQESDSHVEHKPEPKSQMQSSEPAPSKPLSINVPAPFQPIPLRDKPMISPSSKSTPKTKPTSTHDADAIHMWRDRMWPTRAIHAFTRVLTRCIPSTTNTPKDNATSRPHIRLDPNWDERCFQRFDSKFSSATTHYSAFFMMLVEECRESLCAEVVNEEVVPIASADSSIHRDNSMEVEVVGLVQQSERGGLPQPCCDSRCCTVNTYRLSILPLAQTSSYSSGNSNDLISGDVVMLSGGSLSRPLLGIAQGWDPDNDMASIVGSASSTTRQRSNSFTGSSESTADTNNGDFINIIVCVDDTLSSLSSTTMRPLGGWADAGMIYNGVQCSLSAVGNALTFIRESQALVSIRHIAKSLQDIILSGTLSIGSKDDIDYKLQCPQLWQKLQQHYNASQLRAIESIFTHSCRSQPSLSLLQGPPGTGKTHTILGIIAVLISGVQLTDKKGLKVIAGATFKSSHDSSSSSSSAKAGVLTSSSKKPRILVCAPSNTAVDELVYRLHTQGILGIDGHRRENLKIVRVGIPGGNNRSISASNPSNSTKSNYNEHKGPQADSATNIISVSESLSLDRLVDERRKLMMNEMKQRSNSQSDRQWMSNMDLRKAILDQADIVCCTLSGAGSQPIVEVVLRLTGFKFDAVIIDEAAQASEPSALIPLKYDPKTVVLVGDPCQLPAVILSRINRDMNYQQSLFERMTSIDYPVLMLETQYRMHPTIAEYSSTRFYQGKLLTDTSLLSSRSHEQIYHIHHLFRPFVFHDISYSRQTYSGTSISNRAEADYILYLFHELTIRYSRVIDAKAIGIIAPYSAQRQLLQKLFRDRYGKKHGVEISTVDGFQGREKDIIIFSCVRAPSAIPTPSSSDSSTTTSTITSSTGIGFLKERQRLNVAVTRAKYSVWIVGCRDILSTDNEWNQLISYCNKINSVISVFEKSKESDSKSIKHPMPTSSSNSSSSTSGQKNYTATSSSFGKQLQYQGNHNSTFDNNNFHQSINRTTELVSNKRQKGDDGRYQLPPREFDGHNQHRNNPDASHPHSRYHYDRQTSPPHTSYPGQYSTQDWNDRYAPPRQNSYYAPYNQPTGLEYRMPSPRHSPTSLRPPDLTIPIAAKTSQRNQTLSYPERKDH